MISLPVTGVRSSWRFCPDATLEEAVFVANRIRLSIQGMHLAGP